MDSRLAATHDFVARELCSIIPRDRDGWYLIKPLIGNLIYVNQAQEFQSLVLVEGGYSLTEMESKILSVNWSNVGSESTDTVKF